MYPKIEGMFPIFQMYQALRNQFMVLLSDEDLAFTPGGENPTLGALCKEMGEVQYAYIESFQTFQQSFDYRNDDPGLEGSVARLTAWYKDLDDQLKMALDLLTEDDQQNRVIDRGGGFQVPPYIHLEIYKEALLIFYGKVSVYLKAMTRPRPEQWQDWIA